MCTNDFHFGVHNHDYMCLLWTNVKYGSLHDSFFPLKKYHFPNTQIQNEDFQEYICFGTSGICFSKFWVHLEYRLYPPLLASMPKVHLKCPKTSQQEWLYIPNAALVAGEIVITHISSIKSLDTKLKLHVTKIKSTLKTNEHNRHTICSLHTSPKTKTRKLTICRKPPRPTSNYN